jgi:hypothetical protein
VLDGIKGIYVRIFEFENPGKRSKEAAEVSEAINRQLSTPEWERLVQVKSKSEDLGVYVLMDQQKDEVKGLVVFGNTNDEIVFVNIVGNINLDDFEKLSGNVGVPKIDIKGKNKDD